MDRATPRLTVTVACQVRPVTTARRICSGAVVFHAPPKRPDEGVQRRDLRLLLRQRCDAENDRKPPRHVSSVTRFFWASVRECPPSRTGKLFLE